MFAMSFLPFMVLVLGVGGQEALDLVDTQAYWQIKGVEIKAESMMAELAEADAGGQKKDEAARVQEPAVDYDALVQQLGSEEYTERESAQQKLEAAGNDALAALEKGADSDDPEISVRSRRAIEVIRRPAEQQQGGRFGQVRPDGPQAAPVRRLMAIRTIGEMKYKEALPLLAKLTESKTPFEADYARQAIAAIKGEPHEGPAPVDAKLLAADVAAMPANALGVMQQRMRPGRLNLREQMAMFADMGMADPEEMLLKAMREIIYGVEQVGNLRLEAVTAAMCSNGELETDMLGLASLRGQFNLDNIRALAKRENLKIEKINEVDVVWLGDDGEARLALVSDSQLLFIGYDDAQPAPPLAEILAALGGGKPGGIEKNEAMAGLLKTVDQKKRTWAALLLTKEMRGVPVLAAINRATLEIGAGPEGKGISGILKARGEDDEQVAQAGRLAEAAWQSAMMQLNMHLNELKAQQPKLAAMIQKTTGAVKFKIEPGLVTVTAEMDEFQPMSMMGVMMGMFVVRITPPEPVAAKDNMTLFGVGRSRPDLP